ncbi:MAG: transketolase [Chloroflexota bacterium]|nr:MAG: transketolase [Chloroflexota bacterium]
MSTTDLAPIALSLRRDIVQMIATAGSGHPGGSLSAVEIIVSLYSCFLRHQPTDPQWANRDRFILSKGHAAPVLYAALAHYGYIPRSFLDKLRVMDSPLQGHPDANLVPGVEASTGSLGQGLSVGVGMAIAARLDRKDTRVYVLMGDGECQEGQVWEAAMSAAHYGLDNMVAIVDHNGLQIDGPVREIMNVTPMRDKWQAFGWHAVEVDGHDFSQLLEALHQTKRISGQPTAIIAHTVKGKGVSFMENNVDFHGRAPNAKELAQALEELR